MKCACVSSSTGSGGSQQFQPRRLDRHGYIDTASSPLPPFPASGLQPSPNCHFHYFPELDLREEHMFPAETATVATEEDITHESSSEVDLRKAANSKDALEDKKEDSELWEAQAAFLGHNLWDKTLPYDPDLKYVDLDEFLSENGMASEALGGAHLAASPFGSAPLLLPAPLTKRERSPSPADCLSPDPHHPPLSPADSTFSMASSGRDFDPRTRAFSDEELKPQPMIKKSRKQFVPDDLKDDKYWARRRKNNMAAKRSRDARRMKENQIALRAGYLEKENMGLRQEVELLKKENHILREKLSKFADV